VGSDHPTNRPDGGAKKLPVLWLAAEGGS
jgi:hypothetical protein